jgi:Geranylgeranyl pyrophosphate synthase
MARPSSDRTDRRVIGLFEAGGKRIRPAFCYWGFRAAGGPHGEPILRAAASLELLHTMALIHDDVMDGSPARRGRPAVHTSQTEAAARRGHPEPERIGTAVAILAGDLSAVLADQLLLESGFPPVRLAAALERYHRMRIEMAAGAHLGLIGADADARRLAALKGGVVHGGGTAVDRGGPRRDLGPGGHPARTLRRAARGGVPAARRSP